MKKILLSLAIVATSLFANATDYVLNVPAIYDAVVAGTITAEPNTATKYHLLQNVTQGIFTATSISGRIMRIDVQSTAAVWTDGFTPSTHRLEPNGNSGNDGRRIYINCPAGGTLTVYAWTGTANRPYKVETVESVGGNATATLYEGIDPPLIPSPYASEAMTPATFVIPSQQIVVLNPSGGIYFGAVKFSTSADGLDAPSNVKEISSVEYYSILGAQVSEDVKGLVIVKTLYKDGTTGAQKIYRK